MRICQIVPSLEEKHGGPSKSVAALAAALARARHQVDLLAAHSTRCESRDDAGLRIRVSPRTWPKQFCFSRGLRAELAAGPYDVIHHHGLWLRTLHYANRHASALRVPLVISPRGMMNPWAWDFHRMRKRVARSLIHPRAFERAAGWHATTTDEANAIRALGFQQPVCVAPNGVDAPTEPQAEGAVVGWHELCPECALRPTALFYSRFHRKKRVLELIDLWLEQGPRDWLLMLVGIPEEYTVSQLEAYVTRALGSGRVRIFDGTGRPPPYPIASLFLLPSHSENFGLVIAEAMAWGLPVVVTNGTPWTAVNERMLGWCVPWEDYGAALRAAVKETPSERGARGTAARDWVLGNYSWSRSACVLQNFYVELRNRRVHPEEPIK